MTASSALDDRLAAIFDARDRENMRPTIDAFLAVLAEHPDDAAVLYEVGGAYDTAGEEQTAVGFYERALALGLGGERLRRCYLQYGSTLRNLGRTAESLAVFEKARQQFVHSPSLVVFETLSLHAAGRADAALARLLELIADPDALPTADGAAEITRYRAAILGNAAYLAELDGSRA